ncbi:hypothetical protein [Bacillus sp. FJAT-52991]|uniref:Uncharacterized protein n=1 Tax=Bacillus kandeliae TaxID=3129297 RepID=A0ABZ2N6A5_9BACI
MDRRSGVLCHTGGTAYDRESGCWSWTTQKSGRLRLVTYGLE